MSEAFERYTALLAELGGLAEHEALAVREADNTFAAEDRRRQGAVQSAERERTDQRAASSRLQVGVRDLARAVGVSMPVESGLPPLGASDISPALRSVQYDLTELRRSLEHVRMQQQALAAAAAPPLPAPPAPAAAEPVDSSTRPARGWTIGALLAALVVVVVIVAALLW